MEKQKENTMTALTRKCEHCGEEINYTDYECFRDATFPYVHDDCRDAFVNQKKNTEIEMAIENSIPKKFRNIETDKTSFIEKYYNKSIFITGSVGSGKTVFLCSMIKKYLKESPYMGTEKDRYGRDNGRIRCKFISFPAWIMSLQGAFKHKDIDPFALAEDVAKFKGILAIDDLGAEKLTEWVGQIIYFVINEREQRELTTLITSNFSLDEIDEQIDSRISSRIAGMCNILVFKGEDRRKQK